MSILELETAVAQLAPEELRAFSAWFDAYRAKKWDAQIADDLAAGRLDDLIEEAGADIRAGNTTPL